jgi:four helix bundle protein
MSKSQELKDRTQAFATAVLTFCRTLPASIEGRRIAGQLGDSATSVAMNYRAACRARTRAEFIAKLGTVAEEADESEGWLAMVLKTKLSASSEAERLRREADELTAIFVASVRTARSRRTHQSNNHR